MIKDVRFEAGKLVKTLENGEEREYDIVNYLRAADIPAGLTYSQVSSITALANLVVILVRTLTDAGVLGQSFLEDGDINLDDLIEAIENMGGDYGDPDLSGSET